MKSIIATKNSCGGKPRIKGTRITVESILYGLASGRSINEIKRNLISAGAKITDNDISNVINYSASCLGNYGKKK